jgi:SAM-dependent methyltransferase
MFKSYLRPLLYKFPFLHSRYLAIKKYTLSFAFESSAQYWEERYQSGYNSGDGSYGDLSVYKAEFLNEFVAGHGIKSVVELGCGDGNQLKILQYPRYTGFDVSSKAIEICRAVFAEDSNKAFFQLKTSDCPITKEMADLSLSLDVVYHLVEDDVFEEYMWTLFESSTKYVIVYSSDSNGENLPVFPHVKHRHFSKWVSEHIQGWELDFSEKNKYPYTGDPLKTPYSFADFFVFKKLSGE